MCQGTQQWTIRGNVLIDLPITLQPFAKGYPFEHTLDRIAIDRNVFRNRYRSWDWPRPGIKLTGSHEAPANQSIENVTITNNFFSATVPWGEAIRCGAINGGGPQRGTVTIAGNTIAGPVVRGRGAISIKRAKPDVFRQERFVIRNNLIANTEPGLGILADYAPGHCVADGNLYGRGVRFVWNRQHAGNALAFNDWQTATGQESHSGVASPAFVSQGVRNGADPHDISGEARFFADDVDGYDTIEWIAKQPWCDGNVAMYGPSYWGATQWLAAANGDPGPPPHLKAMIPSVINPDFWERAYRAHGALNLSMTTISRAFNSDKATFEDFMYLPLIDMDKAVGGRENTLWNEYVSHGVFDEYWAHIGMRDKYRRIKIPVYIYAGWWDYYSDASLKYYNLLRQLGHTPEVRVWADNAGHRQMPLSESIRWLDWVIKGKDSGIRKQPPVRLFVQGVDEERCYNQWPPAGTRPVKYYLHSPDGLRIGSLDTTPPADERPTRYTYNPRDPVPSIGGNANHRGVKKTRRSGAVLRGGSFDQRPVEDRSDVLIFTTAKLTEDIAVIGPVSLKLHASTDARDTDFTSVLIDVLPDGKAMNVTEGIVRARFRESIWEAPKLLTPGVIYEYTLELLPTARVFRKGHRIRLHLSSSRFPLWGRNTNTGNAPATDRQIKVACQTIYHDSARASRLLLPVVHSER